jgi:hypothetical protein
MSVDTNNLIKHWRSSSDIVIEIIAKVKVKLFLCVTNEALRLEDVWGSGCIEQRFLALGSSWR